MIKKILVPLILITLSFITYLMVTETIESNKHFLGKLKEYDNNPFLNSPLRNLAPEEIKKLTAEYKIDLTQLDSLKSSAIALVSFCGILVIAIIVFKPDFSVKKFDGLTVMAAYTLLICATFTLFKIFIDGRFEDGHNATIGIRASIEIILMIITPLIFFTTFKMNRLEIGKNMHQAKWITNLSIFLTVLTGLLALVIRIAVLSTPDVSTFTN
jgi:hypothetical protein